jgi:hypothetical protein
MLQRFVVMTAAWLEIIAGATLLTIPGVASRLLFAAQPGSVGIALGRCAGIGILALGIACLPSKAIGSCRGAVFGLLVYNVGVAILFAWVGIATTLNGVLLWPAAVLHVLIAAALLPQLLPSDPHKKWKHESRLRPSSCHNR